MKKKVMAFAAVLAICGASSLCHNAALAQAGMTTATPSLGVTSSFGIVPGDSVGPNGLPLNASPGASIVPNGLTGTITVPNASSGAACSTVATSPEGTFGSPTTYDGGGMAGATTTPAAAATPGSLPHEVDVQIMAFILKKNGYPAGDRELIYEEAEKSRVPIRYHGK